MKCVLLVVLIILGAHSLQRSYAEVIVAPPFGVNKITCLANSDTIVGIPFRKQGSLTTSIGTPTLVEGETDLWLIPLASLTLEADSLNNTHYLHMTSGTHDGRWYDIVGNTTNSVTIDLNGDELTGVANGDSAVIAEYWTLDTLFPPDQATGDATTTGHAIVGSSGTGSRSRMTEILYPDLVGAGINRAATKQYFIDSLTAEWKDSEGNITAGNTILWPDVMFTIRHPSRVSASTAYIMNGEVITERMVIGLSTNDIGEHDNYIALPRPVDVALEDLNLGGTSAYVGSAGVGSRNRKDEILLVDNSVQGMNKSATIQYYYDSIAGIWRNAEGDTDATGDVIPAGTGFVIRKSSTVDGITHFWQQSPSY